MQKVCSLDVCGNKHEAKGYCNKHYMKWRKWGDPLGGRTNYATPEESFEAQTEWHDGCLVWVGGCTGDGYGYIRGSEKYTQMLAHRYAWEQVHGTIPEGVLIDHKCFNRKCCNVVHLRTATRKQNNENLAGLKGNNTSGHRNVYWNKESERWVVLVGHLGKKHYGGMFRDKEEANRAAIGLRAKLHTPNDMLKEGPDDTTP